MKLNSVEIRENKLVLCEVNKAKGKRYEACDALGWSWADFIKVWNRVSRVSPYGRVCNSIKGLRAPQAKKKGV